jgi:hypothetical protein
MSAEIVRIFVGLDLGQSRDPSALAVVERAELLQGRSGPRIVRRRRWVGRGPRRRVQLDSALVIVSNASSWPSFGSGARLSQP